MKHLCLPFILLNLILLAVTAFAQNAKPAAFEVVSGRTPKFITMMPNGGLGVSAKTIGPREIFRLENPNDADLQDGDLIKIRYEQSVWGESENVIRRYPERGVAKSTIVFTVKMDGSNIKLIAPSGRYVAGNTRDGKGLSTTEAEGEALSITVHWNPKLP